MLWGESLKESYIYIKKNFDFNRGVELNITATQELLFTFDKNIQIHA
jgi:hypothetical protein